MKKRVLAFLLAAVVSTAMLSGCTGTGSTGTADTKKQETVTEEEKKKTETKDEAEAAEPAAKEEAEEADFAQEVQPAETTETPAAPAEVNSVDTSTELTGKHHIEIDIQGMGTIYAELDADSAPITVTNFVKLAQEDFYDNLTFHRIIDGFMIQGGDPLGNGTGGSKMNIKGEFKENGVENNLSHVRGALSMARAQSPDSASSQFFIVQTDSHFLDGKYAVFGYVTDGLKIVDDICKAAEPIDANGNVAKDLQPLIEDIRVID